MRFLVFFIFSLLFCAAAHSEVFSPNMSADYESPQLAGTAHEDGIRYVHLNLQGGSELKLISPERWAPILDLVRASLPEIHRDSEQLFGDIPALITSIRLIDDKHFFQTTGAPKWTSALYFRGEIMIPIESPNHVDLRTLNFAVRHEYTHAVIHALSDGKCPGWLDEGLAQWVEDGNNPVVRPSLRRWLREHQPLKLEFLQQGFTQLDYELASAAYAQSLFSAHQAINIFGFKSIRLFFDGLRNGLGQGVAFERAFSMPQRVFEENLGRALLK